METYILKKRVKSAHISVLIYFLLILCSSNSSRSSPLKGNTRSRIFLIKKSKHHFPSAIIGYRKSLAIFFPLSPFEAATAAHY